MNQTIFIVEYGSSDLGGEDSFTGAFTTNDLARAHAMKCAEEGLEGLDDPAYTIVDDDDGISIVRGADDPVPYPVDWWHIREVPLYTE